MQTTAAVKHWQKIGGPGSLHGVVSPVMALRSEQSLGCGDFNDLKIFIDWISQTGLKLIQLLPINDTGFDASPYAALGAFSLNPIYIHLGQAKLTKEEVESLREIERLARVPYQRLRQVKLNILARLVSQGWGADLLRSFDPHLSAWTRRIYRYAQFMALKDLFELKPWWQWPEDALSRVSSLQHQIEFYLILQLVAHQQLQEATAYALKKGIQLVGDIPILLCRDSSEVYFERNLFNLNLSAGAPPDQFSPEGQNWGFPTYNWSTISEDGYAWWRDRLQWAQNYFSVYRIDHVAGFFGIWSIPPEKRATDGFYYPQDPDLRLELGQARLRALLDASDCLPIGEDLGHIDPRIRTTLMKLGIPGMKVMRWHRHWDADGSFVNLHDYPKISLACVSTHDSSTLRQWFSEDPGSAQDLSNHLGINYPAVWNSDWSKSVLHACHRAASALHINLLVDYLDAFEALQSREPSDYRINVPGLVQDTNWTIRYRQSLEQLSNFEPLKVFWRSLCD